MTSKRRGLIIGGVLAGSLLLGSAGLVAAQDPTASPSPSATWSGAAGMMGGADMKAMAGLHQSMATNGTCDPARMRALHPQVRTNR